MQHYYQNVKGQPWYPLSSYLRIYSENSQKRLIICSECYNWKGDDIRKEKCLGI